MTRRLPGLDTLRALAILVVVCWHMHHHAAFTVIKEVGRRGWAGVDLFFVLSGYLIGYQLLREVAGAGGFSLSGFYWRRGWRILPCFWVVLALYFLWPAFRESTLRVPLWRFLTFTQNFGLHFGAFSHAWSLCIEEQFYWLFPLAVLLLRKRPRLAVALLVSLLLGGMLTRGLLWRGVLAQGMPERALDRAYYEFVYYPTYSRLDGLCAGITIALLRAFRPGVWRWLEAHADALLLAGAGLIAAALRLFEHPYNLSTVIVAFPLLSMGAGLLVASAATGLGWLGGRRVPGARTVATLAFSIYLTHKQVLGLLREHLPLLASHPRLELAVTALAIAGAGALLHFAIEKPALWLRDEPFRRSLSRLLAKGT